ASRNGDRGDAGARRPAPRAARECGLVGPRLLGATSDGAAGLRPGGQHRGAGRGGLGHGRAARRHPADDAAAGRLLRRAGPAARPRPGALRHRFLAPGRARHRRGAPAVGGGGAPRRILRRGGVAAHAARARPRPALRRDRRGVPEPAATRPALPGPRGPERALAARRLRHRVPDGAGRARRLGAGGLFPVRPRAGRRAARGHQPAAARLAVEQEGARRHRWLRPAPGGQPAHRLRGDAGGPLLGGPVPRAGGRGPVLHRGAHLHRVDRRAVRRAGPRRIPRAFGPAGRPRGVPARVGGRAAGRERPGLPRLHRRRPGEPRPRRPVVFRPVGRGRRPARAAGPGRNPARLQLHADRRRQRAGAAGRRRPLQLGHHGDAAGGEPGGGAARHVGRGLGEPRRDGGLDLRGAGAHPAPPAGRGGAGGAEPVGARPGHGGDGGRGGGRGPAPARRAAPRLGVGEGGRRRRVLRRRALPARAGAAGALGGAPYL
ncbi:MAG: hypothetical protein AVDCRST_MAG08-1291, partial [uncultured Acetobacteraceae bacterium]